MPDGFNITMGNRRIKYFMKRTENGFTLIELAVTIAIIAIVASIAIPSMKSLIINMRMNQATEIIKDVLEQARVESFVKQKQVIVRVSGNQVVTSIKLAPDAVAEQRAVHLHPSVIISPKDGVRAGVYFDRGIPQDAMGVPLGGQRSTDYEICYRNEATQKQIVRLEGRNTITVLKNAGACQ